MKRTRRCLLALAVPLAVLAGCSGSGVDESRQVEPPAPATPSTVRSPAEGGASTEVLVDDLPTPTLVVAREVNPANWADTVEHLRPLALPSDCGLPISEPISLPNSPREYRGGIHQGIDFICGERGRSAVAALPGRVVFANAAYEEPTPTERTALLAEAQSLGRTPQWILAMLYGRFVVLDHGIVSGVGHVTTLYAHLERIAEDVTPGAWVEVGWPVGEIGNAGTESGVTGVLDPRSLHLHWEIYVDEVYVGAGLGPVETGRLYELLFTL